MPALDRGAEGRRILTPGGLAAAQARVFEAGLVCPLEVLDFCCGKVRQPSLPTAQRITASPQNAVRTRIPVTVSMWSSYCRECTPDPRAALPPRQRGRVRTGPPNRPLDSARQIRDARER